MKYPKFTSRFGKIKIYSSKEHPSGAENVLVVPGFGETITHNKYLVDALSEIGFNAQTFSQPRNNESNESNDSIERQGEIVLDLLDSEASRQEKVHAVAHSLGCAALLKAAIQEPDRFLSLTLMQPVGMAGNKSLSRLVGRVSRKVVKNHTGALKSDDSVNSSEMENVIEHSARIARSHLSSAGVLSRNPRLSLREALASGDYDITRDIRVARKLGIPINIVKSHSDELFESEKLDETYQEIAGHVDSYSSVSSRSARHDNFWLNPERTAKIIGQLISRS